ncbi:hypothetical protein BofuT4_uP118200.1 [Botrytis cinerea T4]|uniref:Uncharacterized protein n=1 Tax=Botryotinia fuckeliana (strain T4) TaxID=999810 RepID=G2Y0V5_BOTF4|nr:hypothetical protein BofuT4_uP118200.1 [Botrytis cinerea T4]
MSYPPYRLYWHIGFMKEEICRRQSATRYISKKAGVAIVRIR